jgi:hypothetical protein
MASDDSFHRNNSGVLLVFPVKQPKLKAPRTASAFADGKIKPLLKTGWFGAEKVGSTGKTVPSAAKAVPAFDLTYGLKPVPFRNARFNKV